MTSKIIILSRSNSSIKKFEQSLYEGDYQVIWMKLSHSREISKTVSTQFFNIYDFHTITIQLMEHEPDYIVYVPYCIPIEYCNEDELNRISNYYSLFE